MKWMSVAIAFVILSGCAKTPSEYPTDTSSIAAPKPVAPAPVAPAPKKADGGIGTIGGGGTLKFSFLTGAMLAKDLMQVHDTVSVRPGVSPELEAFYQQHRLEWMAQLDRFVNDPQMIREVSEKLIHNNVSVGGLSSPPEAPTEVLLSVPYLTTRAGFPTEKAMALAIHESGHFAIREMDMKQHAYLDQIASLLLWARDKKSVKPIYRVPYVATHGSVAITSDGRKLIQKDGGDALVIHDLQTGLETVLRSSGTRLHPASGTVYCGSDWVAIAKSERQYQIQNLVTNEAALIDISKMASETELLANIHPMFQVRGHQMSIQIGYFVLTHDLRDHSDKLQELPKNPGSSYFNDDLSVVAVVEAERRRVTFQNPRTGEILDWFRSPKRIGTVSFLSLKKALVRWSGDRETGATIVDLSREEASYDHLPGDFRGVTDDCKGLVFVENPGFDANINISIYDVETRETQKVKFNSAGYSNRIHFGMLGNSLVLEPKPFQLALFDVNSGQSTSIKSEESEHPMEFSPTLFGRALISLTGTSYNGKVGKDELVVRFIDIAEK